jgi:leader peptidase (prepilin peptidase)/N-methyltransferase
MTILFVFLGLLVGGLVNQLGSDLPARRRPGRPHCPYCGQDRRWWQWLSLSAYVIGQAGCRSCGAEIGIRHPLVEIGLAAAYGVLWLEIGPSVKLALYLAYTAILSLVLVTDVERRLILNVVTYPAILLALVASFFTPGLNWQSALIGGAIAFLFFLAAAVAGNALFGGGALGGGDVKLAAFIGLIVGFPLVIEALVLTILIGAVASGVLLALRVRGMRDYVPYGPFLVAGAFVTLVWGYPIAGWFLG